MSDSTISGLPVISPSAGLFTVIDNGATTGKITLANLAAWMLTQGGGFGVYTYNGRAGAVTPQASDVSTALGFTLTGTVAQSYTLPTTTATLARTDAGQTFTGTQVFGAITAATINGETITPSGGTFSLATGKTFAVTNSLTLSGTDGTVMTFPTTSATLARIDAANIFTGTQTIGALVATTVNGNIITTGTGVLTLAAAKTLTANNTLTLAGTDGTAMTFPTTSDTVAGLNQTQTFLGNYTFSNPLTIVPATAAAHAVQAGQTMGKNKIKNGGFRVNQLGYVSGTSIAVAPGVLSTNFAHDMWRNGTNPSNYTFTQSKGNTTVTIAAGSFITAVEDVDVQNTKYVLSWTGGAVARFGMNGAAPSGNFAASPIYITTAVVGTQMNFEFAMAGSLGGSTVVNTGSGTLGTVQCEEGILQTTFENLKYDQVLRECNRYLPSWSGAACGLAGTTSTMTALLSFGDVTARTTPTGIATANGVAITAFSLTTQTALAAVQSAVLFNPSFNGPNSILVLFTVAGTPFTQNTVLGVPGYLYMNGNTLFFTGAQI
jgi:hypothetical protein